MTTAPRTTDKKTEQLKNLKSLLVAESVILEVLGLNDGGRGGPSTMDVKGTGCTDAVEGIEKV